MADTLPLTREQAANLVIALINHKALTNNPETLKRIEQAIGVTKSDLLQAIARGTESRYQITLPQPAPQPAARPAPQRRRQLVAAPPPIGKRAPTRQREHRTINGVDHLYCSGYKDSRTGQVHEPHWAPIDEFLVRADRPHLRVATCHAARKLYQRSQRVSVKALAELATIGLVVELDGQSNLIGVICKACGEPFRAGQTIEGEAAMRHTHCERGI